VLVCAPDHLSSICNVTAGTPTTEVCDGLDDDCDGVVDNVANATLAVDASNCGTCFHACGANVTCVSGMCSGAANCTNGMMDGTELGVDCGLDCPLKCTVVSADWFDWTTFSANAASYSRSAIGVRATVIEWGTIPPIGPFDGPTLLYGTQALYATLTSGGCGSNGALIDPVNALFTPVVGGTLNVSFDYGVSYYADFQGPPIFQGHRSDFLYGASFAAFLINAALNPIATANGLGSSSFLTSDQLQEIYQGTVFTFRCADVSPCGTDSYFPSNSTLSGIPGVISNDTCQPPGGLCDNMACGPYESCDQGTGSCYTIFGNGNCFTPPSQPGNQNCTGLTKVCNRLLRYCTDCWVDTDCSGGMTCDQPSFTCV
ncbi:MAG TPA: hypothetical protein VKD22_02210, partial [Ramlibacter sp.]|nr:hypothetical protein [Ramlibacter sp.]